MALFTMMPSKAIIPNKVINPKDDPVMRSPGTTPIIIGGIVMMMIAKRRSELNCAINIRQRQAIGIGIPAKIFSLSLAGFRSLSGIADTIALNPFLRCHQCGDFWLDLGQSFRCITAFDAALNCHRADCVTALDCARQEIDANIGYLAEWNHTGLRTIDRQVRNPFEMLAIVAARAQDDGDRLDPLAVVGGG